MTSTATESDLRRQLLEARAELSRSRSELRELSKVGMALMNEREPRRLFDLILTQARSLTSADGGSLYLAESDDEGAPLLHFIASQTGTYPDVASPTFRLPLDQTSIAGYAATTGKPLVLEDVYELPEDVPFAFNRVFDETYGYRAKSMLVAPMIDHRDHVVGVLQLVNRKSDPAARILTDEDSDRWVLPFTERDVTIVSSLAGQAAVAIENGRLYKDIENLFEGFMNAATTAIEQRDKPTQGHSRRVTLMTCAMAELVSAQTEGPFAGVAFSPGEIKQLRYAGMLHDFGKVGVPEATLLKERKLPRVMRARVEARFTLIGETLRLQATERKVEILAAGGSDGGGAALAEVDASLAVQRDRLARYWAAVQEADVPRVLDEDAAEILDEISQQTFTDPDGHEQPYLTEDELHYLRIPRGNLDPEERRQIESHVQLSYDFLLNIPWTEELSRIAEIVRGHHEKLDGSGYPDRVTGESLSLETRIMTVCDIFDALTASDRKYKPALTAEKALEILDWEVEEGKLDPDVVELFKTSRVYEEVLPTDEPES